jgi:hypothetical protein
MHRQNLKIHPWAELLDMDFLQVGHRLAAGDEKAVGR